MQDTTSGKISVLLPAHNEGRHIYRNLLEIKEVLNRISPRHEIIVVDDGSRDNTSAEIKRASAEMAGVKHLSYPENQGKGWALRRAFQISSGDRIFFLDSDLDIHPRQFDTLLRVQAESNADVVIGSKRHPQSTLHYPPARRIVSAAYFFLVKLMFKMPLRDTQTGIKIFRREVLENVFPRMLIKRYAFDLELLVNAHHQGFKIAEAPVVVDFKGRFGRIDMESVWVVLRDTLAIYYRLNILGYYDRPLKPCLANPMVSIIIAFKTPCPCLEKCLAKIEELDYDNYEVLLLPDGPMEHVGANVRVIPTGPVGPPRKRDIGARESSGDILAFIDDDAYPQPDWLTNAMRAFNDDSIAAIGGPASTPPTDDVWERAGGRVLSCWMVAGVHIYRFIPKMTKEVDDYPTSNLMVRKSDFNAVGGFDTPFWPGEDTVLCMKITKGRGKKIVYDPDVQVWHHRRPLFRAHWRQVSNYATHRGYFVKRFPQTSRRFNYFLPSIWTLFILAGWIPLIFVPSGLKAYASVVVLYLLAAAVTSLRGAAPKMAAVVATGIVSTHIVYGLNFIKGLLKKRLDEE
jgi:glycosyltransferase involved in cell wall biosynthesis